MISSKDNNLIKLCQKLKQKKYSREYNKCFVETYKIIKELYNKNILEHIFVVENKLEIISAFNNIKYDIISENVANFLTETKSNDGVFAIAKIPKNNNIDYSKCLILDNIQDPTNIGAIVRSACAFGFTTIFAIDTVYPYTYKCIRSSMSYIFGINYIETTYDELIKIKQDNNIVFISADMNGTGIDEFQNSYKNIALIIGNEGQGVNNNLIINSDKVISIPMLNNVESLNASVSAGILMFNLK